MSKEFFSTGGSHNTIAFGTSIKGDINAEADLRIDGMIDGHVSCTGKVVVGPKATVTGDISAESAEILGNVTGNIQVKDLLSIKASAKIHGNVEMHTLSVEPPAFLSGNCVMIAKGE
ncbi:MAG: polymer-forming cytoskeletal protein [Bacteroidales bacterium]|nr:polymer-forming cytoskeletal protein [Bacteroidales bacterium]